jgi:tetratricopeptide (TPR) repeat protein
VELTKQCLMHLSQVTQGVEYEVIVVDNASSDGTAEFLAGLSGNVQIISNDANLGFAKACNQGARAAKGRYLVFLNNDTIPLEGWLAAMVDEVKTHPEVAVVGSKLLYPDDTIQHAGVVFSRCNSLPYHVYSRIPSDVGVVNRRREFQVVTGACMLVRKEVFEAVRGFDEGYRNGFEDVDLCLKIRDRGGRVVYQPKSVLYHLESQTPGRKDHDEENAKRLLGRWGDQWLVDEDVVCGGDGFVVRTIQKNGALGTLLEDLTKAPDRASWERVAEVERLALSGDIAAIRPILLQVDLWPDDLGALRWAAAVCMRVGAPEHAEAFWRHMLKYEGVFDARAGLARLCIESGAFDEAEEHLKVLSVQVNAESLILRGVLAMQRLQYAAAADAFNVALQRDGDSRKAHLGLSMAAMALGQTDEAWEHCATVLSHEIDDAEAIHCLLRAGTALGRWRPLADYLTDYLRLNPGDNSVRFASAGVHVRLEDWEGAREAYEMIRLLDPTFEGLDDLAQILERRTLAVMDPRLMPMSSQVN